MAETVNGCTQWNLALLNNKSSIFEEIDVKRIQFIHHGKMHLVIHRHIIIIWFWLVLLITEDALCAVSCWIHRRTADCKIYGFTEQIKLILLVCYWQHRKYVSFISWQIRRGLTFRNMTLFFFLTQQTRWISKSIDVLAQELVQVIRKGKYMFRLILIGSSQLEIFLIFAGLGWKDFLPKIYSISGILLATTIKI